jgi:hypothetical protein
MLPHVRFGLAFFFDANVAAPFFLGNIHPPDPERSKKKLKTTLFVPRLPAEAVAGIDRTSVTRIKKRSPMHPKTAGFLLIAAATFIAIIPAKGDPPTTFSPPIPSPPPIQIGHPHLQPLRIATVTFPDQSTVQTRAAADKFQMIAARPGETITVVVPMPVSAVPILASIAALDGGQFFTSPPTALTTSVSLGLGATLPVVNGKVVFNFQVAGSPGLYRVLVLGVGRAATLQFWVQDVQRPATNPWAVNSAHWQSQ